MVKIFQEKGVFCLQMMGFFFQYDLGIVKMFSWCQGVVTLRKVNVTLGKVHTTLATVHVTLNKVHTSLCDTCDT
jgi:hypothetical protein